MKKLIGLFFLIVVNVAHCEETSSIPIAYHASDKTFSVRVTESIILVIDIERTIGRSGRGRPIWKVDSQNSGTIIPILRIPMHGVITSECDDWHQTCAKYTAPAVPGHRNVLVWDDHNQNVSARVEVEVTP